MSSVIDTIERAQLRRVPAFAPGDRLKVHFQVIEGTRRRVQVFEGVVIKRQGHGARETFTVRKQSFGVGVERTFPVHSPKIERIELAARGDVRRAKLYYLRERVGKRARVRERRYSGPEEALEPGLLHEPGATDAEGMTADEAILADADRAEPGEAAEASRGEPAQASGAEQAQASAGAEDAASNAEAAGGSADAPDAAGDAEAADGSADAAGAASAAGTADSGAPEPAPEAESQREEGAETPADAESA